MSGIADYMMNVKNNLKLSKKGTKRYTNTVGLGNDGDNLMPSSAHGIQDTTNIEQSPSSKGSPEKAYRDAMGKFNDNFRKNYSEVKIAGIDPYSDMVIENYESTDKVLTGEEIAARMLGTSAVSAERIEGIVNPAYDSVIAQARSRQEAAEKAAIHDALSMEGLRQERIAAVSTAAPRPVQVKKQAMVSSEAIKSLKPKMSLKKKLLIAGGIVIGVGLLAVVIIKKK